MQTLLQVIRLLTLVLWVGGLAFFAFVLAPIAFSVLPTPHLAGLVVGATLRVLHWIGLLSGTLFLLATVLRTARKTGAAHVQNPTRNQSLELLLCTVMLAATAYSQFRILPAMERDRLLTGADIEAAPASNPGRRDFDRLHALSEKVEGLVFFAGLGLVFSLSREHNP